MAALMLLRIQDMPVAPVPLALKRLKDGGGRKGHGRKAPTLRYTPLPAVANRVKAVTTAYRDGLNLVKKAERTKPHDIDHITRTKDMVYERFKTVFCRENQRFFTDLQGFQGIGRENRIKVTKDMFSFIAGTVSVASENFYARQAKYANVLYNKLAEFIHGPDQLHLLQDEFEIMFGRNSPHSLLHLITPESRATLAAYKN